jgi:IS5 family transposase
MRPRERRDSGQNDLFRARLDQIVDLDHPLAKLGRTIDWRFLEARSIPTRPATRRCRRG